MKAITGFWCTVIFGSEASYIDFFPYDWLTILVTLFILLILLYALLKLLLELFHLKKFFRDIKNAVNRAGLFNEDQDATEKPEDTAVEVIDADDKEIIELMEEIKKASSKVFTLIFLSTHLTSLIWGAAAVDSFRDYKWLNELVNILGSSEHAAFLVALILGFSLTGYAFAWYYGFYPDLKKIDALMRRLETLQEKQKLKRALKEALGGSVDKSA